MTCSLQPKRRATPRGKFLSEIIKRKITNIREVETIKFDGFKYKSELSTENNLVFVAKR